MSNLTTGGLEFFKVGKYDYKNGHICDFSNSPRPHFCMGLIIKGKGIFKFSSGGKKETVEVGVGDIIFVPVTSRYISVWQGDPDVCYVSFHFYLSSDSLISEKNNFKIQKVTLSDFEALKEDFLYAFKNYNTDSAEEFISLGIFYKILGKVFPQLKALKPKRIDERIEKAVEYINLNSESDISVPELAHMCNLSPSHFYTKFKQETGVTPVDFKNRILINRASKLLICNKELSIEEIGEILGFNSATYFRRIFRDFTGKSPREYRKEAIEL